MILFKPWLIFALFVVHVCSFSSYMIPKLRQIQQISTSFTTNIRKMQVNSKMIASITSNQDLKTWNQSTYMELSGVKDLINNYYNSSLNYIDFAFDGVDSIALITSKIIAIVNLTSNTLMFKYQTNDTYKNVQITSKYFILLTYSSVAIFDRINYYNLYNYVSSYNLTISYVKNHLQTCYLASGDFYLAYWNDCNKIYVFQWVNTSWTRIFQMNSTYSSCTANVNTINFNKNCSLMLIQMDNLASIQVFNTKTKTIQATIQKPTQLVYNVQFYDPISSNYVMVFYQNNSIICYDISQSSIGIFVGQMSENIAYQPPLFIDTSQWKLYFVKNLNIQVYKLQCLYGTAAYDKCCAAEQFYHFNTTTCQVCSGKFQHCSTCNQSFCLSCLTGTFFSGLCCQSNQYFNSNDIQCELCSSKFVNCLSCSENICFSCLFGVITYGKCCFQNQTYNARTDQCQQCALNCFKCLNSACLACKQGFSLVLNQCIKISQQSKIKYLSQYINFTTAKTIKNPLTKQFIKSPVIKTFLNAACGFFGPLDDLWIFSYHQRNYTLTVASFLNSIREIQSSKFNILNNIKAIQDATDNVIKIFNSYTYYGKQTYMSIQGIGSGFYQNMVNFVMLMMTQTIILFAIIRVFFQILINYKISRFIRQYSFNIFLLITILDGNQQFITYISCNQIQTLFQNDSIEKNLNFVFLVVGFFYFQALVSVCLLMSYFYGKLSKYFMANNKNSIHGVLILILNSSLRHLAVAAISSFSSNNYQLLIWSLNIVQFLFITTLFVFLIKYNCFKNKTDFWIIVIFSFMRLLLQFSFAILNKRVIYKNIQQEVQSVIILLYLLYWISTILFFLIRTIMISLFQYFKKQIQHNVEQLEIKINKKSNQTNSIMSYKIEKQKLQGILQKNKMNIEQVQNVDDSGFNKLNLSNHYVFYSLPKKINKKQAYKLKTKTKSNANKK